MQTKTNFSNFLPLEPLIQLGFAELVFKVRN